MQQADFVAMDWTKVPGNVDQKLVGFLQSCTLYCSTGPEPWMVPVLSTLCGTPKKVEQMHGYLDGNRGYAHLPIVTPSKLSALVTNMVQGHEDMWNEMVVQHKPLPKVGQLLAYFFETSLEAIIALEDTSWGSSMLKHGSLDHGAPGPVESFLVRLSTGRILRYGWVDAALMVAQPPMKMLTSDPTVFLAFRQWLQINKGMAGSVGTGFDYSSWKTLQALGASPKSGSAPTMTWTEAKTAPSEGGTFMPPPMAKKPFMPLKKKQSGLHPTAAAQDVEPLKLEELPDPVIPEALKASLSEEQQASTIAVMKALRGHVDQVVNAQLANVVKHTLNQLISSNPQLLSSLTMSFTAEQLKGLLDVEALALTAKEGIQDKLNASLQAVDAAILTEDIRTQVLHAINVSKMRDELLKSLSKTGDDYMVSIFPRIVVHNASGQEIGHLALRGSIATLAISPELKAAAAPIAEKPITGEKPLTPKF